jgi:hypothetical protein
MHNQWILSRWGSEMRLFKVSSELVGHEERRGRLLSVTQDQQMTYTGDTELSFRYHSTLVEELWSKES